VTWVLLSEIFPNFIREKALSIASCALWTACFLVVLLTPALLNLSPVFNFILFGSLNGIGFVLMWKWLPETKGRSLEEMEDLWKRR
jgi:SP family xylose:H+ symportor-like MFS transporter